MNFSRKGLVLAALQVLLVASLGAKLKWDRAHLPRVWVKAAAVDPALPIRGRYLAVRLAVQVPNPPTQVRDRDPFFGAVLSARSGQLVAEPSPTTTYSGIWVTRPARSADFAIQQPVLFFLPEHAADPMAAARNGELWAEVTVPDSGLPRPIRLAIKRGETFTPIEAK
jgi:hypothetical protein